MFGSFEPLTAPADYCGPATPNSLFKSFGLGYSDFARHYFRNHGCFLFLQVLRWFTSLSLLNHPMYSDECNWCSHQLGFPIRKSPDRRLLASPRGLSQLTTSFIACLCQGIHTHALSSLTIKSISHTKCPKCSNLRLSSLGSPLSHLFKGETSDCGNRDDCITCDSNNARQIFNCQRSDAFVTFNGLRRFTASMTPKIVFPFPERPPSASSVFCYCVKWWAWVDSNYRPHPYQGCALTN